MFHKTKVRRSQEIVFWNLTVRTPQVISPPVQEDEVGTAVISRALKRPEMMKAFLSRRTWWSSRPAVHHEPGPGSTRLTEISQRGAHPVDEPTKPAVVPSRVGQDGGGVFGGKKVPKPRPKEGKLPWIALARRLCSTFMMWR
ncbi:hypothetical protein BV898_10102 [Hypsibius exemplaris]|uniref:Uncharacterized protein n=1 Tax=Hypsibius exemplaris TaxID=2072580 RepID=A0A1W0WKN4_HYPEX|nr:hypothetical protein BV898_10102 [Hypsibius exemplaris]